MHILEAKKNIINVLFLINMLWLFTAAWVVDNGVKILTVSVATLLLFTILIKNKEIIKHIRTSRFIWVCILLCLATVLTKYFHGGLFGTFQRATIIILSLSLCIREVKFNSKHLESLLICAYIFHILYLFFSIFILGKDRPEGNINPNIYAPVFGLLLIFNTYHSIKTKNKTLLIFLPILIYCILIMQSRGVIVSSILSFIFLLISLFFRQRRMKKAMLGFFALLLSIAAFNSSIVTNLVSKSVNEVEMIRSGNLSTSLGLRIQMLYLSIDLIKEKPITGHGDSFTTSRDNIIKEKGYNNYLMTFKTLHNAYLDSWSKLGIFGFIVSIVLTISPYLILVNTEHSLLGVSLSIFTFVISLVDTALLGGTYLLLLTSLSLILKVTPSRDEIKL